MSSSPPAYNLEDFIKACGEPRSVFVRASAMRTAPLDFNLETDEAVLSWIAGGGIEKPEFTSSRKWENNPDEAHPILVDAYNFYSGLDYGYLAFMYQPATKKWLIKSLKKNEQESPRPFLLADKMKKAGLLSK